MSDDLFNTVVAAGTDRPEFRQAPEGTYLARIQKVAKIRSKLKGTPGVELTMTLMDPLDVGGADLDGIDLGRCRLSDTLYVTPNSAHIVAEQFSRINPESIGMSLNDALDVLPASEVVVRLKHVTENSKGEPLRIPRLEVTSYYSTDWYYKSRAAA